MVVGVKSHPRSYTRRRTHWSTSYQWEPTAYSPQCLVHTPLSALVPAELTQQHITSAANHILHGTSTLCSQGPQMALKALLFWFTLQTSDTRVGTGACPGSAGSARSRTMQQPPQVQPEKWGGAAAAPAPWGACCRRLQVCGQRVGCVGYRSQRGCGGGQGPGCGDGREVVPEAEPGIHWRPGRTSEVPAGAGKQAGRGCWRQRRTQ
ncbi:hypothetical protein MRX96_055010 [Rhipicephalus microplus]